MRGAEFKAHGKGSGVGYSETTKAAAWAVFQHHGGSAGIHSTHGMAVRRATRFKIEAQMKSGALRIESSTPTFSTDTVPSWDAGSTLFDSYELDYLFKKLDQAFHPPAHPPHASSLDTDPEAERTRFSTHNYNPQTQHQDHNQLGETGLHDGDDTFVGQMHDPVEDPLLDPFGGKNREILDEAHPDGQIVAQSTGKRSFYDELHKDGLSASRSRFLKVFHFQTPHLRKALQGTPCRLSDNSHEEDHEKEGHHHQHHKIQYKLFNFFHSSHSERANLFHGKAQIVPQELQRSEGYEGKGVRSDDNAHLGHTHPGNQYHHRNPGATHLHHDHYRQSNMENPHEMHEDDEDHRGHHLLPHVLKSRLRMVLPRPFCRLMQTSCTKGDPELESVRKVGLFAKALHSFSHSYSRHGHQPKQQKAELEEHLHEHEDHHEHQYHHHHDHLNEDYEFTVQDIVSRVPRKSFEERARRLSIDDSGLKVPRNSFEEKVRRTSHEFEKWMSSG